MVGYKIPIPERLRLIRETGFETILHWGGTICERLWYALRNETDGFAATTLEPHDSGLTAYVICNAYGIYHRGLLTPRKHRKMIVEVAKDNGGNGRCKRFNWNDLIPIEVSQHPQILLKGMKLRCVI